MTIGILEAAGVFAENKDVARGLRTKKIMPALKRGDEVTLDFAGVEGATQSFIHALISDAMRTLGGEVLDKMVFKNCNLTIQAIITVVTDYMQQSD